MRPVSLEELRRIQTEILSITTKFCEENNIHYWLDGGTLLGAIRHDGYIPWDDDIDLGMLRPDFDRFIREFNGYNAQYEVKCVETDPDFTYAYAKVLDTRTLLYEPDENGNRLSINIDVFVYDHIPENPRAVRKLFRKRDFYRNANGWRTLYIKPSGGFAKRLLKMIFSTLLKVFPRNYFAKKEVMNAKTYSHTDTARVGNLVGYALFTCETDVFDSFVDHVFEGKMYKIPSGYDKWLTRMYGDYMKLPPVEKRVTHHSFKAYIEDDT